MRNTQKRDYRRSSSAFNKYLFSSMNYYLPFTHRLFTEKAMCKENGNKYAGFCRWSFLHQKMRRDGEEEKNWNYIIARWLRLIPGATVHSSSLKPLKFLRYVGNGFHLEYMYSRIYWLNCPQERRHVYCVDARFDISCDRAAPMPLSPPSKRRQNKIAPNSVFAYVRFCFLPLLGCFGYSSSSSCFPFRYFFALLLANV